MAQALTDEKLVTVPITETEAERKAREKQGIPLPHFSYVAVCIKQQGKQ